MFGVRQECAMDEHDLHSQDDTGGSAGPEGSPPLEPPAAVPPPHVPPAAAMPPLEPPAAAPPAAAPTPMPVEVPPPAPAEKRSRGLGAALVAAVIASCLVATLIGAAAGVGGAWLFARSPGAASPTAIRVLPPSTEEPVSAAAAAALPSVVNVDVTNVATPSDDDEELPEGHPDVPSAGTGSGVAWKRSGDGGTYIITNNHVVAKAKTIVVKGVDRESRQAKLIGRDEDTDIAVLKVQAEYPVVQLGDSQDISVGQLVVAIGSPFGLSHSVTSGVISAIGRSLPDSVGTAGVYPLVDVIQTDAAINPGNSGGALVDREGRLLGINTAIFSDSGANEGIGFAVPANTAVRVAQELIDTGTVKHPFLGVIGQTLTPEIARAEGISVTEGALVVEVTKGGGAEKAGVKKNDVIVGLDDADIRSMDDLILAVRRHRVGDEIVLEVVRAGKRMKLTATVGDRPSEITTTPEPEDRPRSTPETSP